MNGCTGSLSSPRREWSLPPGLRQVWRWVPPAVAGKPVPRLQASPVVVSDRVYIGSNTGMFYALRAGTGGGSVEAPAGRQHQADLRRARDHGDGHRGTGSGVGRRHGLRVRRAVAPPAGRRDRCGARWVIGGGVWTSVDASASGANLWVATGNECDPTVNTCPDGNLTGRTFAQPAFAGKRRFVATETNGLLALAP